MKQVEFEKLGMTAYYCENTEDGPYEIHMFGNYVGVGWPLREIARHAENNTGLFRKLFIIESWWQREKETPRMDFFWVREDTKTDSFYLDEDDSVAGQLHVDMAEELADELNMAARYIKRGNFENPFGFANE